MAGHRALVGQVSLYPLVREQPIVSIAKENAAVFTILTRPSDGAYYTTCTRIDCSVLTCSRSLCMRPVSAIHSVLHIHVSMRLNPSDDRDEMVLNQARLFRNPVGQQVTNHRGSLQCTPGLTTPHDRSTDAKTGQHPFRTPLRSDSLTGILFDRLATLDSSDPNGRNTPDNHDHARQEIR